MRIRAVLSCLALAFAAGPAHAASPIIPILAPLTGFLALEGSSQRNGAQMALAEAPAGLGVAGPVIDTGTAPEAAVNAFERAIGAGGVAAVAAPMLGTQMLALLPLAADDKIPLITISGTAKLTEAGNPWIFRFFPSDALVKVAHARYLVEEVGAKRVAVVYQTTAYGQGGREVLLKALAVRGAEVVFDEGVDVGVRDLLPVIEKLRAAKPDAVALHLHAPSTALFVRQAAAAGLGLPIVAGSAMHQPSTAALVAPPDLKGVCAETAASPISGGSPAMEQWVARYRTRFQAEPDAYALSEYDGIKMLLGVLAAGADRPEAVRAALASGRFDGLGGVYQSDGKGNMSRSAVIVCYDGTSRIPHVVKRYDDLAPPA